jgi:hypothetical protein
MLDNLNSFVSVLLALSIASERLVELVKGLVSRLDGPRPDPREERLRQWIIHAMSVVASCIVVYLAQGQIASALKMPGGLSFGVGLLLAILASGGSSFWNSILTWLLSLKNLNQQSLATSQKVGNADLLAGLPDAPPTI